MLLILAAGVGLGVAAERRLQKRWAMLVLLSRLIQRMGEQIRCTAAPLGAVWQMLATGAEFERLPLLHHTVSTREERCRAVELCAESMALDGDDKGLLLEFLGGCGETDIAGEVTRCQQYARLFYERSNTAKEEVMRRGKLCVTLGVCGGSMAALLLGG